MELAGCGKARDPGWTPLTWPGSCWALDPYLGWTYASAAHPIADLKLPPRLMERLTLAGALVVEGFHDDARCKDDGAPNASASVRMYKRGRSSTQSQA